MADLDPQARLLCGEGWSDYGLIDSGDGRKLERYGPHRFIRPDAQALWAPRLERWKSDGEFVPGSDEDGGGRSIRVDLFASFDLQSEVIESEESVLPPKTGASPLVATSNSTALRARAPKISRIRPVRSSTSTPRCRSRLRCCAGDKAWSKSTPWAW